MIYGTLHERASFILVFVVLVRNGFNVTSGIETPEGYLDTICLMILCFSSYLSVLAITSKSILWSPFSQLHFRKKKGGKSSFCSFPWDW